MPRSTVSKRIRYTILYLQSNDMERLKPVLIPSIGQDTIEFLETIICSGKCQKLLSKALHSFVLYERNRTVLLQNEPELPTVNMHRNIQNGTIALFDIGGNVQNCFICCQRERIRLLRFTLLIKRIRSNSLCHQLHHMRQFYKFRTK